MLAQQVKAARSMYSRDYIYMRGLEADEIP